MRIPDRALPSLGGGVPASQAWRCLGHPSMSKFGQKQAQPQQWSILRQCLAVGCCKFSQVFGEIKQPERRASLQKNNWVWHADCLMRWRRASSQDETRDPRGFSGFVRSDCLAPNQSAAKMFLAPETSQHGSFSGYLRLLSSLPESQCFRIGMEFESKRNP